MKIYPLKICANHHNRVGLKAILLPLFLLVCVISSNAQKERNVKLKLEGGFLWGAFEEREYRSGRFFS